MNSPTTVEFRKTGFLPRASDSIRFSLGRTEDTLANVRAHPLWDGYWESKQLSMHKAGMSA